MIFTKPDKSQEQTEIAELKRMLGRLTMQLEIAKKASSLLTSPRAKTGNGHESKSRLSYNRRM